MPLGASAAARAARPRWPAAALLAFALSSCGGGGGGGGAEQDPPPPRAATDPETQPGAPIPAVAAPTGLALRAAARQLAVSWSPVAGAASYRVQWKSGDETYDAGREVVVTTGTRYTIANLIAGRQYTVRVLAVPPGTAAGTASQEVSETPANPPPSPPRVTAEPETQPGGDDEQPPPPPPPPTVAAPTGVMLTTGAQRLVVAWSAVTGAESYRVQWKSGNEAYGGGREVVVATGTSYTIANLMAGQQYTVRVLAIPPGGGTGTASTETAAVPTAPPPPPPPRPEPEPEPQPASATAPTGVGVTAALRSLTVSWSAATGAAEYKVQWKSGSESYSTSREATVSGTSHTIPGLIPGRQYTIRVLTVPTDGGTEPASTERTARPAPPSHAAVGTLRAWTSPPDGSRYPAETLQPANPTSATSWRTAEYNANGLDRINAAEGYAACAGITGCRPGGGGRTIAIIGADLYTGHQDLQGSINRGTDIASVHETQVIGVAAARRNGVGMHGVAYNANIVGFGYQGRHYEKVGAIFASIAGRPQEVLGQRTAYDSAADSAHIALVSIETQDNPAEWKAGMEIAAAAGRIMVFAAGNTASSSPSKYPAKAAGDAGIAGHAIVVGGLNEAGTGLDTSSNTNCGSLKEYCMVAPKRGVYTTTGRRGDSDNRYTSLLGTSYAAPFVAGAAAVVWNAFPNKTGAQIIQRLLTTAFQVDPTTGNYDATTGLSDIYGHGRLDLGAAMSAVGWTSAALPGGGLAPVRRSFVDLPPGFRLRPNATLSRSVVYDEQMFPFPHDLNTAFRPHRPHSAARAMEEFLASLGGEWTEAKLGERTAVEFASTEAKPHRDPRDESGELDGYRLRTRLAPDLSLTLGRGFGAVGASSDFVARRLARGLLHDGLALGPFAALAGSGAELGAVWELDERTRLDVAGKDAAGYFGGGRARLASLGATRRFGDALTLGARWGRLRERGSLLGARGFGAFGGFGGAADTDFLDLSAERRFGRMTLFGGVSRGWTRAGATPGGSLIAGWSGLRGDSFALGGEWPDLWRRADRLTLIASSPFRARGAAVQVDVPERETADGVVAYARHRADLSPRGRELRLQLAYETEAAPGAALSVGGYLRLEPEHDPAAKTEFGAAAKLRLRF